MRFHGTQQHGTSAIIASTSRKCWIVSLETTRENDACTQNRTVRSRQRKRWEREKRKRERRRCAIPPLDLFPCIVLLLACPISLHGRLILLVRDHLRQVPFRNRIPPRSLPFSKQLFPFTRLLSKLRLHIGLTWFQPFLSTLHF